MEDDFNPKKAQ